MKIKKELDKITKDFLNDLVVQGISPMSIANYKSDLNNFESWLTRKLKTLGIFTNNLSEALAFVGRDTGIEFKRYLLGANTLSSSLNRRLSTLRRLSKFLLEKGLLEFDFMAEIKNTMIPNLQKFDLDKVTNEFKHFLESEKVTNNTIKNYVSDVKHFVKWFNENNFKGSND